MWRGRRKVNNILQVDSKRQMKEFVLANEINNHLQRIYPNYRWMVAVDTIGGIIKIAESNLQDPTTPYMIRLDEVPSDKILHRYLIKAGGEILERFNVGRERKTQEQVRTIIKTAPRDVRGNAVMDKRDTKNWCGK